MAYIVCVTKPNHEAIAAVNLRRQGFSYYYPRFMSRKPGVKGQIRPLFPRYIFVQQEQVWHSLNGTRGISSILMGERGPQLLSDSVVAAIKSREDKHGLFQLEAPPKFIQGSKVRATEGPLAGLPLIYEGMAAHDRVKVLSEILGRKVVTEIEEKILVAA